MHKHISISILLLENYWKKRMNWCKWDCRNVLTFYLTNTNPVRWRMLGEGWALIGWSDKILLVLLEWEENYLTLNDSDWIISKCEAFIAFSLQDFTIRQMSQASRTVQWHHNGLPKSEVSYSSSISSLGSFCSFLSSWLMTVDVSWFKKKKS